MQKNWKKLISFTLCLILSISFWAGHSNTVNAALHNCMDMLTGYRIAMTDATDSIDNNMGGIVFLRIENPDGSLNHSTIIADSAQYVLPCEKNTILIVTNFTEEPDGFYLTLRILGDNGSSGGCDHDLEWEIMKKPTKDADGLMVYKCKKCGQIIKYMPYGSYLSFNLKAIDEITNAAEGATVIIDTLIWESFARMTMSAIAARRDLTIELRYRIDGKYYLIIIPAGAEVPDDVDFAGFNAYLAGLYGKSEVPKS